MLSIEPARCAASFVERASTSEGLVGNVAARVLRSGWLEKRHSGSESTTLGLRGDLGSHDSWQPSACVQKSDVRVVLYFTGGAAVCLQKERERGRIGVPASPQKLPQGRPTRAVVHLSCPTDENATSARKVPFSSQRVIIPPGCHDQAPKDSGIATKRSTAI